MEPPLDLPRDWLDAVDRAAAARRILVVGPTDVGKSSFIRALAGHRPEIALLDLDPGQKMIGPPGTASLGSLARDPRLERFVFLGSTAVGGFRQLLAAASSLAIFANGRPLVVNTSGYVAGPGARLQLLTFDTLKPDLVVAVGLTGPLSDAFHSLAGSGLVRLQPSPAARRKSEGRRRAIRQQGFDEAMAGATEWSIDRRSLQFEPGEPMAISEDRRPVCALADAEGREMEIGLVCDAGDDQVRLLSRQPARPVRRLRLGKMWAGQRGGEWQLLDALAPAWQADA